MTILQDLEARNTIQEYRRLFIETSPSYTCISTNGIDSTRLYMCLKDIATINAGDQGLKGLAFDCEKQDLLLIAKSAIGIAYNPNSSRGSEEYYN